MEEDTSRESILGEATYAFVIHLLGVDYASSKSKPELVANVPTSPPSFPPTTSQTQIAP